MSERKMLAKKLHKNLCPKCNGRCRCIGARCSFEEQPKDESVWEKSANGYFLGLAEKTEKIMEEIEISEDEFIGYAKDPEDESVPDKIRTAMEKYEFN